MLAGAGAGGAGDSRRTNAELHIGLCFLHHLIHFLDHQVHIMAAPVGYGHVYIAIVPQVIVGGAAIGGRTSAGIKVVVKDNAVNVIVLNHLLAHLEQVLARPFESGVEHYAVTHLHEQSGVLHGHILGRVAVVTAAVTEAVWVHPRVALQTTLVALLNGKCQRIPAGIHAARAAHITRPRFIT